jgi:hypothetical protein
MQIDFHHAATYVACRLAGLNADQAATVAHAAQYVDDATIDGAVNFADGQRYVRATSAHKMLDHENADTADNRLIWTPFHFLPGADDSAPGGDRASDKDRFIRKMMCRPNSPVAQTMITHCIEHQDVPFALHRLGIGLHTFADTWAHHDFVGMVCDLNRIRRLEPTADQAYVDTPVYKELAGGFEMFQQRFANLLPVGHAGAITFPDLPFLKWSFTRENGEQISRDNPTDFLAAFRNMYAAAWRHRTRQPIAVAPALSSHDEGQVDRLLRTTIAIHGEERHAAWLNAIGDGTFSFGPEQVGYIEQGVGSWKYSALGADPESEDKDTVYAWQPGFLQSDWKHFHDAVHFHRAYVLHELLPSFGLCAS